MLIHILGTGAGGGFPQWNCHCPNCTGLRNGSLNGKARTQSSIAVSAGREEWVLINASPDLRSQIQNLTSNLKSEKIRHSPVASVVLVDAQLDHAAGLALLREGPPLEVYCTREVYRDLINDLPLLKVIDHFCGVNCHTIGAGEKTFTPMGARHLNFTVIPLRAKAPRYSRHRQEGDTFGQAIALYIEDSHTGGKLLYSPALAGFTPELLDASLDWIWNESSAFNAYRGESWMKEPCRSCPEKKLDFGGCRCQAFALTGEAKNADPVCAKSPHRSIVNAALSNSEEIFSKKPLHRTHSRI